MRLSSSLLHGIISFFSGCGQKERWQEGGLYATPSENATYSILKILKLDDQGVHVRVYSNQFATIPMQLDETTLYMRGMDRKPDEQLGMGHLPLSRESFETWQPHFIKVVPVDTDELEGYEMWKEEGGGYF